MFYHSSELHSILELYISSVLHNSSVLYIVNDSQVQ